MKQEVSKRLIMNIAKAIPGQLDYNLVTRRLRMILERETTLNLRPVTFERNMENRSKGGISEVGELANETPV